MEKKLTIAHLAPYLPYGLKFKIDSEGYFSDHELTDRNIDLVLEHIRVFNHIKPILRPLSQLAQEIEHNGERFVPYKKLGWESGDMLISCVKSKTKKDLPYRDAVKLFEWRFDVFSLIPQGLAIEKGAEG